MNNCWYHRVFDQNVKTTVTSVAPLFIFLNEGSFTQFDD